MSRRTHITLRLVALAVIVALQLTPRTRPAAAPMVAGPVAAADSVPAIP